MSEKRRTAAIVGCGDIAHYHMQGYQLAGVDVVAFVDPLAVARDQFVTEYGGGRGYASLAEMLAAESPDLVSVCAWHLLHAPLTVEAAAAGVQGIICEKPMAVSMAGADRMVEACDESGTKLAISHQRRFTLGWEKGRELIAAGALGDVLMVTSQFGAGLLNCGTHAIDGVRFVLGDPDADWVMGAVERRTDKYERDTPIEDACMGLVHFANGVQLFLQVDLEGPNYGFQFFVRGTEGMMEVSETACRTIGAGDANWVDCDLGVPANEIDVIGGKANGRQTQELLEWIDGGAEHRCAGTTARDTVEIMMALEESARRHQVVHMPLAEKGYPLELMIGEGKLPVEVEGRYDIRSFLKREDVDEAQYAKLRATGMGHHPIMRKLWELEQQVAEQQAAGQQAAGQ
ncbi:MAG TPA: Gfo/Idh/MocA family oxidoreductase [Candidatus Latescibacteria bacterium]|jgi:predicted dehydrogenase|nr:Gfo/Idh/MocA family oxidoreductase [Candidatus Latescibacterota bacterium]HJP31371.1 Gfo/Idh/MocA family oxidoreductase [Candidatus Latescibacterota bacterium]